MKQLKISLSDDLRARLETISAAAGNSVAEEIRQRVERTIAQDADPPTGKLLAAIDRFAVLVKLQTNYRWHDHAAAGRVFRRMITARLARLGIKSPFSNEAVFQPGELPTALLVNSEHPDEMGTALEAVEFHTPQMTAERQRKIEEADRALRQELSEKSEPPIRRRQARGGKS